MTVRLLSYLFFALAICSCAAAGAGQGARSSDTRGEVVVVDAPDGRDLTAYLRTVTGLNVTGDGASASVTIRGLNSLHLSQEPLFVIDGTPVSGGLASAYSLVTVNDIDYIRVLKNGSDLATYGVRGGNGVIEITTKK